MWTVEYLPAAIDDLKKLDNSQQVEVIKMRIIVVSVRTDDEVYEIADKRKEQK